MTVEAARWHRLVAWRDDADLDVRCRSCGIPIRVGGTYRVSGIFLLCTLRPFCPAPAARPIGPEKRRAPQWKRRRHLIVERRPVAVCICGTPFRRSIFRTGPQQACSRPCTYRLLEARAAAQRQRACAICAVAFTFRSEHPTQATCSPSCGSRLREQRKREARAA